MAEDSKVEIEEIIEDLDFSTPFRLVADRLV